LRHAIVISVRWWLELYYRWYWGYRLCTILGGVLGGEFVS
jgi:hypothetical protein